MTAATLTVLVYSDDADTRAAVQLALGRRPATDLPRIEYVEVATEWAVLDRIRAGGIDLAILDGEAVPSGGMGVCRTMKEEIFQAPPVMLLLGRPQDQWLAAWSRADGAVSHPIDPIATANAAAALLRSNITTDAVSDSAVRH
jgi:DNA-binding response OmpR family regulator